MNYLKEYRKHFLATLYVEDLEDMSKLFWIMTFLSLNDLERKTLCNNKK